MNSGIINTHLFGYLISIDPFATTSTAPVEAAAAEPLSNETDPDEDEEKREKNESNGEEKKPGLVAEEEKTR